MMAISFARQSWERRRYPFDEDTQEFDFTADPVAITILRCSIQPGAPIELLDGREANQVAWTIFQPSGHDVSASDFGWYQGALYRVSGEPQRWEGPTPRTSHDVVLLERWKG